VTDDKTHDGEMVVPVVRGAQRKVKVGSWVGDGGYDTHDNFNFLASEGIDGGIKVREDSDPNCGGAREEVRAYLRDQGGRTR
jgi:hypothetical protein